jgi:hypothetical protein
MLRKAKNVMSIGIKASEHPVKAALGLLKPANVKDGASVLRRLESSGATVARHPKNIKKQSGQDMLAKRKAYRKSMDNFEKLLKNPDATSASGADSSAGGDDIGGSGSVQSFLKKERKFIKKKEGHHAPSVKHLLRREASEESVQAVVRTLPTAEHLVETHSEVPAHHHSTRLSHYAKKRMMRKKRRKKRVALQVERQMQRLKGWKTQAARPHAQVVSSVTHESGNPFSLDKIEQLKKQDHPVSPAM